MNMAENSGCCGGSCECGPGPARDLAEAVEARYARLAQQEGASCSCGCTPFYTPEDLAGLPPQVAGLSLGCGNPVALASLRPGEVVLDIGSGAGLDVFLAARRVGPEGRAIGLDMTEAMIERAGRMAETAGIHNVEFRLGQAEAIPLPDESVDVILSNCVINLSLDKGKVFREAYRVLRPGGRLAISDVVADKPLPEAVRSDPDEWSRCVGGALPEGEYLALVAQAGFEQVQCLRESDFHRLGEISLYSVHIHARKGSGAR